MRFQTLILVGLLLASPAAADRTRVFSMQGADCADCGAEATAGLKRLKGVRKIAFDKHKVELTVTTTDQVSDDAVIAAIARAGFVGVAGAGKGAYLPHPDYPEGADVRLLTNDGSAVGPLELLRVEGKYTAFDVYADWCGPCRAVDARLRELSTTRKDLAVRKLNVVDFDSPLAKQLGASLRGLPHVIVFTPSGRRIEFEGADLRKLTAALAAK